MEPVTPSVAASTTQGVPVVGFDIFSLLYRLFGGSDAASALSNTGGILGFLDTLWSVFVLISFFLCAVMLILYIYASIRRWHYYTMGDESLREMEELYDAQFRGVNKRSRMDDILQHSESENPNDWKLAIIEADIILDDILKQNGYAGNSLGERLKSISPQQLSSLNDAWEAHKVRNLIAHEGQDFVLTKRKAEETINRYRRVFAEFGIL